MYVRHHCWKCHSRVFPFDKYEALTEDPLPGKKGGRILLHTHNTQDPDDRQAWCWACNKLVHCHRMTEDEFLKLYLARRGVVTRDPKPRKRGRKK